MVKQKHAPVAAYQDVGTDKSPLISLEPPGQEGASTVDTLLCDGRSPADSSQPCLNFKDKRKRWEQSPNRGKKEEEEEDEANVEKYLLSPAKSPLSRHGHLVLESVPLSPKDDPVPYSPSDPHAHLLYSAQLYGPKPLCHPAAMPPQSLNEHFNMDDATRTSRDGIFGKLYVYNLIALCVVGCLASLSTTSSMMVPHASFQSLMLHIFMPALFLFYGLSYVWLALLYSFSRAILWSMIGFVPGMALLLSFASFIWSMNVSDNTGFKVGLAVMSVGLMLLSLTFIYYIRNETGFKTHFHRALVLLDHVIVLLRANPVLFIICGVLLGVYIVFLFIWLHLFSALMLIPSPRWTVTLQVWFTSMLIWTTALMGSLQRFSFAYVMLRWYQEDEQDQGTTAPRKDTGSLKPSSAIHLMVQAFRLGLKVHFGSLCLGALLIYTLQSIYFVLHLARRLVLHKTFPRTAHSFGISRYGPLYLLTLFVLNILTLVYSVVQRLAFQLHSASIDYIALNGQSTFIQSGRKMFRLYQGSRALSVMLVLDWLLSTLVYVASCLVGVFLALLIWHFELAATTQLFGLGNLVVLAMVVMMSVQRIGKVLLDTLDIAFLVHLCQTAGHEMDSPIAPSSRHVWFHAAFGQLAQTEKEHELDGPQASV